MTLVLKNIITVARDVKLLSFKYPNYILRRTQVLNLSFLSKQKVNVPHNISIYEACAKKSICSTSSNLAMFNIQDEDDFKEKVIKSDIPVVLDFHASWCGPCKILGPRLESIIGGMDGKVHLAKVDIDSISDLALEYGVSAVPSVIAIKNGKVVDKFVGLQDEARIDAFVRKLIEE